MDTSLMLSAIAQLRITFRTGGVKCVKPNDKASRKQYVQDMLQPLTHPGREKAGW